MKIQICWWKTRQQKLTKPYISQFRQIHLLETCFKDLHHIFELKKRSDQVVVMTGGPRGIGFDIVKKLLQLDYTVILGVRNISASQNGIDKIRSLGITSGGVKFLNLDLKSLNSVRQFAKEVLTCEEGSRIDLLLNNAGSVNGNYEITPDNMESTFQVNYLSHFLLTNLLLPRIKETAAKKGGEPCQIVNTSSHVQNACKIKFNELETSKVYVPFKSYCKSKLYQVVHVKTLENKFREEKINVHAYAVHPGEIATDIWDTVGIFAKILQPVMNLGRTTDGAANTVLYPVLTPEVGAKFGGEYFESGQVKPSNKQANKLEIQEKLWERSLELTKDFNEN
ncbi:unnamed protein product [Orchesella dallaii]|uniref:NAD(P)-binding protein n=1 Tax=Orchesella dallaii TaxID=48710 RepID=A0ABP1QGN7_9HEXA